jgi:hypothetical protein
MSSYHTAYLRQRADLYLQYPPSTAVHLPAYVQRLLGYGMHAPVLNKLYCGPGPFSVLPAFREYGGGARRIDWAGSAVELPGAEEYARFCGWAWKSLSGALPPPPPVSENRSLLALGNIGSYMLQLPPRQQGLVTVDTTRHSGEQAYGLALAALVRDGCVVLGRAVPEDTCEECMRQVGRGRWRPAGQHAKTITDFSV